MKAKLLAIKKTNFRKNVNAIIEELSCKSFTK